MTVRHALISFSTLALCNIVLVCIAIQHQQNLIWSQKPLLSLTVSKLVGIEGEPETWIASKKPIIKHIRAPNLGWEFKALGFSYRRQTLLWSEVLNKKIQALVLNGSTDTLDVFTGTSPEVNGIVVDWLSNNVYWTDALYNWVAMAPLEMYSTDRIYKIVVQQGLDNPHGLACDPRNNWLALSDWGTRPRIELLSMDGGKRQIMVDKDMIHPKGLAFNPKNQRLYWVDTAKETIESVVVQSREQQRHVLKMDHDLKLSDIAVYGDYIFVTEQKQGAIKVIREGSNNNTVDFSISNIPFAIIMYDESLQPTGNTGCDDFGCKHMCLLDPFSGPKCICGEGYRILDDMKSCEANYTITRPSHIYAVGRAICIYPIILADMSLKNVSLTSQCIRSTRYSYLALTFDAAENQLYFTSNVTATVNKMTLENGASVKIIASGTGNVKGISLDWMTGNLFWTDSTNAYIKVSRKDGRFQRILLEEDIVDPLGITVHPKLGKIYWTDIGFRPNVLPKIESANMDGSERKVIMGDNLGQPNHLLIDYASDRLYWSDSILNHIREYDLYTHDVKIFFALPKIKFYGISLYQDYILWTDTGDMNGIHVARLDTGRKVRGIVHPNYGLAADLITFDPSLQPSLSSPCNTSHYRCDHLCLPHGEKTFSCQCGLGYVTWNESSCLVENYTQDNFVVVNDAYQRNLYQIDVANVKTIRAVSVGERHKPIALSLFRRPPTLNSSSAITLFWSDNEAHIIRRKQLDQSPAQTFIRFSENSIIDGLAADSQNHLLYYTDAGRDLIGAVSLLTSSPRQTIVVSEGLQEPRDIVLCPSDGMMIWSDWGVHSSISQSLMNGAKREIVIAFHQPAWPNGLAIDCDGKILYYADAKLNQIGFYQLNTKEHRVLLKEPHSHYFSMFLMGDFLYVTDWNRRYLARMHKEGGPLLQFGESKFTKLYGVTGFNSTESVKESKGICSYAEKCNNLSICIPTSSKTYVCACIIGYTEIAGQCIAVSTLKITTNVSFTQTSTLTTENNSCCFSSTSNTGKPTDSIETATLYRNGGITSNTDFASNVSTTSSTLSISSSHIGDNTEDQNDYDDAHSRHKSKNVQTKTPSLNIAIITVLTIIVAVALVIIAAIAVRYNKRRYKYALRHRRLEEASGGSGNWIDTNMDCGAAINPGTLSVTYARHDNFDGVRFSNELENRTDNVTITSTGSRDELLTSNYSTK